MLEILLNLPILQRSKKKTLLLHIRVKRWIQKNKKQITLSLFVVIHLLFALFTLYKSFNAFNTYIKLLLPMIICEYILIKLYERQPLIILICLLELIGTTFKCISNSLDVFNQCIFLLLMVLMAVLLKIFRFQFHSNIYLILTIFLYSILILFGYSVAQTKAWIFIPFTSMSVQLTELIKVSSIFYLGAMFSTFNISYQERYRRCLLFILFNMIMLGFLHELGTAVILVVGFIGGCVFFLPNRYSLYNAIGCVGVVVIVAIICIVVHLNYPNLIGTVFESFANLFEKIATRFLLIFSPEAVSEYNYQSSQAHIAIITSGVFGVPGHSIQQLGGSINLPALESDFAFISLLFNGGILMAGLVLLLLVLLIFEMIRIIQNSGHFMSRSMNTPFLVTSLLFVIIQSFSIFYIIFMNLGFLPIMGIPLPFISDGFTFGVLNVFCLFYILNNEGGVTNGFKKTLFQNQMVILSCDRALCHYLRSHRISGNKPARE